jgi:hypothetical protein
MSIKKAMQTYARQGGSSSIFVHDDGLQALEDDKREERIRFYADQGIGWVARPKHDSAPGGFKRAGRFKKASNMNYGLALSLKMEEHIRRLELERGEKGSVTDSTVSDDANDDLEEQALRMAIEDTFEESGRQHRPWAHNARALRIGEIILIVDADTIVPEVRRSDFFVTPNVVVNFPQDCFRDAARELTECPEVAIIQHESGMPPYPPLTSQIYSPSADVMQVANHYFENGIAHFTRRINKCISMACANGEVAPFVGHNAFLRWSAIQDVIFEDASHTRRVWSETNVSEDFDMALRLIVRVSRMIVAPHPDGRV